MFQFFKRFASKQTPAPRPTPEDEAVVRENIRAMGREAREALPNLPMSAAVSGGPSSVEAARRHQIPKPLPVSNRFTASGGSSRHRGSGIGSGVIPFISGAVFEAAVHHHPDAGQCADPSAGVQDQQPDQSCNFNEPSGP